MEKKSLYLECPSCKARWTAQCPTCKRAIQGTIYVCPECSTMYCIGCAIKLSERKVPCSKCGKLLRFD
ncbi:MAG: hypothetical protein Q6373_011810 [Candidatus Sigynarchaeota archaeon]